MAKRMKEGPYSLSRPDGAEKQRLAPGRPHPRTVRKERDEP